MAEQKKDICDICGSEYKQGEDGKYRCAQGHLKFIPGKQYSDYPFRESPWESARKRGY